MNHIKDRLSSYHDWMQDVVNRYKLVTARDFLEMIEQLQEDLKQDEKENGWIPVSERLPEAELVYESSYNNKYESKNVLIQTKRDEIFSAYYIRTTYKNNKYKEEIEWYTYGTGGRRMKVMSKVVAWMPLPELYTGE